VSGEWWLDTGAKRNSACVGLDTGYSNVNPGYSTLNSRVLMPKILRYSFYLRDSYLNKPGFLVVGHFEFFDK